MTLHLPKQIKYLTLGLGAALLGGCALDPCCNARSGAGQRDMAVNIAEQRAATLPAAPIKMIAIGHGTPGAYTQNTHAQQRLMAMRAAQVDAYRNLAEQVYGFRVWGGTTVSAFATQSDSIRTYIDAYIRGARLVNMTSLADGNFEATVELEVTPQFHHCLASQGDCGINNSAKLTNPTGASLSSN